MFTQSKKVLLACILVLVVLMTGAWQNDHIVLAESQKAGVSETPLYPGLTWSSPSLSVQDIRINIKGDSISLSGERYEARERFAVGALPQAVLDYYSNIELAKSGWKSYDTISVDGGVYYVYYQESGVYLSVEFTSCTGVSSVTCIAVWKGGQTGSVSTPSEISGSENIITPPSTFGKKTPANGSTDLNPASVVLSWAAYSPTPDKYIYCVKEGSACDTGDPDWTSVYDTSVTLTNLAYNKTYYWQVKAVTCVTCVPKTVVYADGGTVWTFKTKEPTQAVILGNAGVAGAVLSYVNGTNKTVTADGIGSYSIIVPFHWSGIITPAKSGYLFVPQNASFSDLTAIQTIQNFNAVKAYTIDGNAGLPGVTLSYTDGTPQTVVSTSDGTYSIRVPQNWSGTVSPSKTGFTFLPASRDYTNVTTNKTAQNYRAMVSISGDAGIAGATLSYVDDTLKTVTANGVGNYLLRVTYGWTGTVTPSKSGFTFMPVSRSYNNLQSSQTDQDYAATDAPVVLSSVRVDDSPTSASSVAFTVTFSEPVTGVDIGDFALATTGLTGTTITQASGSSGSTTYTVTVNTGSGSGVLRLDVVDDDSIKDASLNPLGGAGAGNGDFTGGEVYEVNGITVLSTNINDGWILESSETSNQGGTMNTTATLLYVGDDVQDKQYRSFLSFNTTGLPDDAVVDSVQLKIKVQGFAGGNMFTPTKTLGNLLMDIRNPYFGTSADLVVTDFQSAPSKNGVGVLASVPATGWRTITLNSAAYPFINLTGTTQFRLRFQKDDNDDLDADNLIIYSGNAPAASRPQLIVEYHLAP